jgi:hypothetical protein
MFVIFCQEEVIMLKSLSAVMFQCLINRCQSLGEWFEVELKERENEKVF